MATAVQSSARPHLHPLLAEFDQHCGETVGALGEMFAELEAMRQAVEQRIGELALCQSKPVDGDPDVVARSHWQAVVDERDRLHAELDAANTELARQAVVSSRLAESRQELAASKEELHRLREEAVRLRAEAAAAQELRLELDEAETELDLVRSRGSELAEALAEQRRVVGRERAEWAGELKQLRQLLERQSDLLAKRYEALSGDEHPERPVSSERPQSERAAERSRERKAARNEEPASAAPAAGDPALESAMAQFSRVQRDAQRRRWKNHQGD